jgi:hypothetical protein
MYDYCLLITKKKKKTHKIQKNLMLHVLWQPPPPKKIWICYCTRVRRQSVKYRSNAVRTTTSGINCDDSSENIDLPRQRCYHPIVAYCNDTVIFFVPPSACPPFVNRLRYLFNASLNVIRYRANHSSVENIERVSYNAHMNIYYRIPMESSHAVPRYYY